MVLLALQILTSWTVEGASKGELESLRPYPVPGSMMAQHGSSLFLVQGLTLKSPFQWWARPMAPNFKHLSEDFS